MSDDIAVYVAVDARNLLADRDAYALDPALPLVTGVLQTPVNRALFGAFRDCAPDRWGAALVHISGSGAIYGEWWQAVAAAGPRDGLCANPGCHRSASRNPVYVMIAKGTTCHGT